MSAVVYQRFKRKDCFTIDEAHSELTKNETSQTTANKDEGELSSTRRPNARAVNRRSLNEEDVISKHPKPDLLYLSDTSKTYREI